MEKIELLSPAKNMECLVAAVLSGADAVYIGGNKFSARAYADNFSLEDIKKAAKYCHLYNVKLYVTLNTLIKDEEMAEALEYASALYHIGIDAIIIQDAGLILKLNEKLPYLELHASTQMTIHNLQGAEFYRDRGFKRLVLSRELSLDEITTITKEAQIETEVFVHGALCICYSGQCLMSSLIGGRSGNRGRCAQPCRQQYSIAGREDKNERGYLLSPKDLCTISEIKAIVNSGVSSLKIEGRMKKKEYVAGVTSLYREAIDAAAFNRNFDYALAEKKLKLLFNREGFTKGYFFGPTGKNMMALNFPKNTGLFLGRAGKKKLIKLEADISVGDGVRVGFKSVGFAISKIEKNGAFIEMANEGDLVSIYPQNYTEGESIYLSSSKKYLDMLDKVGKNLYDKKIDLPLDINFKKGEPIKLCTFFKGKKISTTGAVVEAAIKNPLTKEKLCELLSKSKDTPFRFSSFSIDEFDEGYLSAALINECRRELVSLVEEAAAVVKNDKNSFDNRKYKQSNFQMPKVLITVKNEEQYNAAKVWPYDIAVPVELMERLKIKDGFILVPSIVKSEFDKLTHTIEANIRNIKGIITSNLGIINKFKESVPIIGDYKLNILNSTSFSYYESAVSGVCLSVELNRKELFNIIEKNPAAYQVLVYGRIELMVSEYMLINNCDGRYLQDRLSEKFPIIIDENKRTHILNSKILNLLSFQNEIIKTGASLRLDFTIENKDEVNDVLKALEENSIFENSDNFTKGHFKRGVE